MLYRQKEMSGRLEMVEVVIGSKSWKLVDFSLLMDVERRNCESAGDPRSKTGY